MWTGSSIRQIEVDDRDAFHFSLLTSFHISTDCNKNYNPTFKTDQAKPAGTKENHFSFDTSISENFQFGAVLKWKAPLLRMKRAHEMFRTLHNN